MQCNTLSVLCNQGCQAVGVCLILQCATSFSCLRYCESTRKDVVVHVNRLVFLRCVMQPAHANAALQEAGAQAVAGAMMATLPGIDANDPRKTLACFRFYSVVLSSVGTLKASPRACCEYGLAQLQVSVVHIFQCTFVWYCQNMLFDAFTAQKLTSPHINAAVTP